MGLQGQTIGHWSSVSQSIGSCSPHCLTGGTSQALPSSHLHTPLHFTCSRGTGPGRHQDPPPREQHAALPTCTCAARVPTGPQNQGRAEWGVGAALPAGSAQAAGLTLALAAAHVYGCSGILGVSRGVWNLPFCPHRGSFPFSFFVNPHLGVFPIAF